MGSLPLLLRRFTWHVLVVLVALGGAGLAVALDHPATGGGRPELTYRGDAAFDRAAPSVRTALSGLSSAADALAQAGRAATEAVRAREGTVARHELAEGDDALTAAAVAAALVTEALDGLRARMGGAPLGETNLARLAAVDAALAAAPGLSGAWADISAGVAAAALVVETLERHDALVFDATAAARDARFMDALALLDEGATELATARQLRDRFADRSDVSTFSSWIDRAAAHDGALVTLYRILDASGGVMTDGAEAALEDVERAASALPADASALVVIVAEVGGETYTRGLLTLERTRGSIAEAVAALD